MLGFKIATLAAACTGLVVAVPTHKHEHNRCDRGWFWWGPKSYCLPHGGLHHHYSPPPRHGCGKHWYWHHKLGYCVPPTPEYPDPECPSGWLWDIPSYSCVPALPLPAPGSGVCAPSEFWWEPKKCCLVAGGPSGPVAGPPNGWLCPPDWYWNNAEYCAPPGPYTGVPNCGIAYVWNRALLYCEPRSH